MKKTNYLYASAIMMACAFGVQSCSVESNPSGSIDPIRSYVYDFEAAFNAGENPDNFNGNQSKGQGFNAYSVKIRNDYKGYTWAEGSVLPQICHVWRRSDRINGNIKEGGLFCPNDREMAIDGLTSCSTVQIFYDAQEVSTSLQDVPFGTWSAWVGGELTTPSNPDWNEGVSSGQPYGDGSVIRYADISAYDLLVVTCTEGSPRFLLNRDIDEGQWSENEAESHLIDNTKDGWSSKYFTASTLADGTTIYTVDIKQLVADKGYAHLHAIKGANWANCTVTSMNLVKTPQLVWAVGEKDASGNAVGVGEGIPVTTALIDGVEAVSNETEIPSGAIIEIKNTTPAVQGTGYFVFKVKKNMVIKKVVIVSAVE